jgi:hypothetical protein
MMEVLSSLEQAVLDAIALQVPQVADALSGQLGKVRVTARKNTGVGFYTTLDVSHRSPIEDVASPLGDVGATVVGLQDGMGFLLWLRNGRIHELEGYSYEESTSDIDFERVAFGAVGPRTDDASVMAPKRNRIYIPLIDEGTDVVRPTLGLLQGADTYRVLATPAYDPGDEHWKFPPGSIVRCKRELRDGSEILVARKLSSED